MAATRCTRESYTSYHLADDRVSCADCSFRARSDACPAILVDAAALAPVTVALVVALIADLDTTSGGLIRLDARAMQRLKADIGKP